MKRYFLFMISIIVLISCSDQDKKWRQLFNGKDLSGWEQVGPGEFVVEDGLLKTVGGMGMILYPAEKFSNVVDQNLAISVCRIMTLYPLSILRKLLLNL
jgi:hypothetical protein